MKHIKQVNTWLLLLAGLTVGIVACHKDPDPTPAPGAVSITGINPPTAPAGSTIAITGTNFGSAVTGTTVTIGGVPATVVSVSPTQIVVTVPVGAMAGPIAVTTAGQTIQSTTLFAPSSSTGTTAGAKPVATKSGSIRSQTWTKDSVYVLQGQVFVLEGYTLTIQPGTIIKGAGPESDPRAQGYSGALVIERVGGLVAKGTVTEPIVFTSAKPAGQRNYGDWGGIVLEGKSPVNRPAVTPYPNGIRGTVQAYGEPFDNAGTLQYVRIEYAGAVQPTVPATRLSGLTMIGVGINTAIDHVQVSYSGGDAFSWFGGTVNAKNLFAYRSFDDDWTVDWGYAGNVQFGVSLRDPDVADLSGSNGFEVENYETTVTTDVSPVATVNNMPQTTPVFTNFSGFAFSGTPSTVGSAKGTGPYKSGIYVRRNSAINIYNSVFYGYPEGVRLESVSSASGVTGGSIDLKGIVLANAPTPVVGSGAITSDQATSYYTASGRSNQVIASTDIASLLLKSANFSLTAPDFVPQTGSPLLAGAVTGGKLTNAYFTTVNYRGAFGADNWLTGWTNLNPQTTNYDR